MVANNLIPKLEHYRDLLFDKKTLVQLAFVKNNGNPHLSPVWFNMTDQDYSEGVINVYTPSNHYKSRKIVQGKKLALTIMDPENLYRYIGFEGMVLETIRGDEANTHIDVLSKEYFGQDNYPYHQPGVVRTKIRIQIEKVTGLNS